MLSVMNDHCMENVESIILVVRTIHVTGAEAHVTHNHVVCVINARGPTSNRDSVTWRSLTGERQERLVYTKF
jgi:hypothetical protein